MLLLLLFSRKFALLTPETCKACLCLAAAAAAAAAAAGAAAAQPQGSRRFRFEQLVKND